jgi:hypothetical protein
MIPKRDFLLGGRATSKEVWHASLGEGLARNPIVFETFISMRTSATKEVVQLCKLAVQQRRCTEIEA